MRLFVMIEMMMNFELINYWFNSLIESLLFFQFILILNVKEFCLLKKKMQRSNLDKNFIKIFCLKKYN